MLQDRLSCFSYLLFCPVLRLFSGRLPPAGGSDQDWSPSTGPLCSPIGRCWCSYYSLCPGPFDGCPSSRWRLLLSGRLDPKNLGSMSYMCQLQIFLYYSKFA